MTSWQNCDSSQWPRLGRHSHALIYAGTGFRPYQLILDHFQPLGPFWMITRPFWSIPSRFVPFGSISEHFGPFWLPLNLFRPFWVISVCCGPFWSILDHFGSCQTISGHFEPFQAYLGPWTHLGQRIILGHFVHWGTISDHYILFRPFWAILRPFQTTLEHFCLFLVILGQFGSCWVILWPLLTILGLSWPFLTIWNHLGPFRTI